MSGPLNSVCLCTSPNFWLVFSSSTPSSSIIFELQLFMRDQWNAPLPFSSRDRVGLSASFAKFLCPRGGAFGHIHMRHIRLYYVKWCFITLVPPGGLGHSLQILASGVVRLLTTSIGKSPPCPGRRGNGAFHWYPHGGSRGRALQF